MRCIPQHSSKNVDATPPVVSVVCQKLQSGSQRSCLQDAAGSGFRFSNSGEIKARPYLAKAESIFVLVLCVCEQNSGLLIEKKLKKQFPKVITLHH